MDFFCFGADGLLQVVPQALQVLHLVVEQRLLLLKALNHLVHFIQSFFIAIFKILQNFGV